MKITDKSPKTYVVLGMHKSGTSFIAKSLHDQGVEMGVRDADKKHTLYEHLEFNKLNREILREAGGSWDNPPLENKIRMVMQDSNMKQKISRLIGQFKNVFWGFKDPRTVLTIDNILPHLKDDVYLVCVFRKPEKVANSLKIQGGVERKRAYELYKEYNRRIVKTIIQFCKL